MSRRHFFNHAGAGLAGALMNPTSTPAASTPSTRHDLVTVTGRVLGPMSGQCTLNLVPPPNGLPRRAVDVIIDALNHAPGRLGIDDLAPWLHRFGGIELLQQPFRSLGLWAWPVLAEAGPLGLIASDALTCPQDLIGCRIETAGAPPGLIQALDARLIDPGQDSAATVGSNNNGVRLEVLSTARLQSMSELKIRRCRLYVETWVEGAQLTFLVINWAHWSSLSAAEQTVIQSLAQTELSTSIARASGERRLALRNLTNQGFQLVRLPPGLADFCMAACTSEPFDNPGQPEPWLRRFIDHQSQARYRMHGPAA